jgi:hypothetical protein
MKVFISSKDVAIIAHYVYVRAFVSFIFSIFFSKVASPDTKSPLILTKLKNIDLEAKISSNKKMILSLYIFIVHIDFFFNQ